MDLVLNFLSFFWALRTIKFVFFWIYLWQLKNYHTGRFADHFRTHQGKKIFFNTFYLIKFLLLVLLFVSPIFIYLVLVVYIVESLIFGLQIVKKNVRLPKFTVKTMLLLLVSLAGVVAYFLLANEYLQGTRFVAALLVFDILLPIIISLIVLFIHMFFVLERTRILKKAARKMAEFPDLTVIGITGSYGKTSTKEFLTAILFSKFNVVATPDHKNSEMGIAQTILEDLKPEHKIFIVEMGAYNKGGIKLLCDMVKPKIGIVTGVNEQHLATFGSLENLLSAEGGVELVKALPKNGLIVVNGANKYCVDLYKQIYSLAGGGLKKKIYTVEKNTVNADIWTEDVQINKTNISFVAKTKEKDLAYFGVNVLGRQNIENILGAVLVAKELGMALGEISQACKHITQKQAGMILKTGVHGINIIDSSYSSNPDGVMADLDYLSAFTGKRVVVMPCLIELGNKSAQVHYNIGKKMAEICDLAIITTKDKFKELEEGFTHAGISEKKILLQADPQEIFNMITTMCKEGDAVLFEGRVPGELIRLLHAK